MASNRPFFTIVTCTYNIGRHLQKNIRSVRSQSFQAFEHLFVDGYSSDNTAEIIREYQHERPQQVRLYQAKPRGIWNAINRGNKLAKGQYILHLEGDNWLHDSKVLADVHRFVLAHPEADWIYGQIRVVKNNKQSVGVFPKHRLLQRNWLLVLKFFNYIPQEAMFVKRSVFAKFGAFNEQYKTGSDYEYWLRMVPHTVGIFCDRVITNYLIRPDAVSSNPKVKQENANTILKIQKQYLRPLEFVVAWLINQVIERRNKVYRETS